MIEKLYRCKERNGQIEIVAFDVIRETPKGYWIKPLYWIDNDNQDKMWVPKKGKSRYAFNSVKEAIEAFIDKYKIQIKICEIEKDKLEAIVNLAEKMINGLSETVCRDSIMLTELTDGY